MGEPLQPRAPISVVVPAHDEDAVIGRLLEALSDRRRNDEHRGSLRRVHRRHRRDRAALARRTVIEQPRLGKPAALNTGDRAATLFPRFYVDADVVVTMGTLRHVARAMSGPVLAGAPRLRGRHETGEQGRARLLRHLDPPALRQRGGAGIGSDRADRRGACPVRGVPRPDRRRRLRATTLRRSPSARPRVGSR